MAVVDDVYQFAKALRGRDGVRADVTTFPSGAVWLDVFLGERLFVLAYLPSYQSFGVDEVRPDDGIGTDFRFGFADFASAQRKITDLLQNAQVPIPAK